MTRLHFTRILYRTQFLRTTGLQTGSRRVGFWRMAIGKTVADLNEAAGAADASRAMLLTSCLRVALLTAIFAFVRVL